MRSGSTQAHWQGVYGSRTPEEVGWFQVEHEVSLHLIQQSGVARDGRILDVGSGATTLLDALLEQGYSGVIAVDISEAGISHGRNRLGEAVSWVIDDITQPSNLLDIESVDLWHDRAVLHFFTSQAEMDGYAETLRSVLKVGGHAVIETFSLEGAPQCSGLDLRRYDELMIGELLGPGFELLKTIRHVHTTPGGGERPYVSTLFRRTGIGG